MKKSEMIRIIAEATESGYGNSFEETLTYEQQLMAKQVAGVVLQAIEDAGMLPPLNENWMSLDECKEFYGPSWENNVFTYPRKNVYRWEPEDD